MTILTPPPGRPWDFSRRDILEQGLTLAQASRAYFKSAMHHYGTTSTRLAHQRMRIALTLSSKG